MSSVGDRLREERVRLGLTQERFGDACGVGKRTQINYESGERSPDADYLQRAMSVGADVTYLLTGERSIRAASTPIEHALLNQAMQDVGKLDTPSATAVHDRYNALYAQSIAAGVHPGQPLSAREESLLASYRASPETGKRLIERMATLESTQAAAPPQSHNVSITGDGNVHWGSVSGSANVTINSPPQPALKKPARKRKGT